MEVREIVLTGGPCGGKTSALPYVAAALREHGWEALCVPETATLLITGGVDMGHVIADPERAARFQSALMSTQQHLRTAWRAVAESLDRPTVILYDRAEPDGAAYIPRDWYKAALAALGTSLPAVRDSYLGVVHLVSAAVDAPEAYTTSNNAARRETIEEAAATDAATLRAWVGHPRLAVIGNPGSFDDKLAACARSVLRMVGVPVPKETERKWLLSGAPDLSEFDPVVISQITQWYLAKRGETERRIRRRVEDGVVSWWYTEKVPTGDPAVREEDEHPVSALDAQALVAASVAGPVNKIRHCFVFAHRQFELDYLIDLDAWMLELELDTPNDVVELPNLPIIREVTDEPDWKNAAIAARLSA